MYAHDLFHRLWVAEDEIAKAEVALNLIAQVHVNLLGILVDEVGATFPGKLLFFRLAGVHDKGNVGIIGADGREKLETSILVLGPSFMKREAAIRDNPQRVVRELAVERPGFLVIACQNDFGTTTHTQRFQRGVECLRSEFQTLLEHEPVEVGQDTAVETDAVLHHHNHLYASATDIMLQIQTVLHQLDDTQKEFRIAQPAEHILEG